MFSSWKMMLLLFALYLCVQFGDLVKVSQEQDSKGNEIQIDLVRKNSLKLSGPRIEAHEYIRELYQKFYDNEAKSNVQGGHRADIVYSYIGDVKNSGVIYFNLSNGHAGQSILRAEFRLKLPIANPVKRRNDSQSHVLILFDVTNQRPVSRVVIHKGTQEWAVFRVKSLVKRWLSFPQTNHGVRLMVKNRRTGRLQSIKSVVRGVEPGENPHLPQLLVFGDQLSSQLAEPPFKRTRRESPAQPGQTQVKSSVSQNQTDGCSKQDMVVNLRELFMDVVISPESFNAYTCEGRCSKPNAREQPTAGEHTALLEYFRSMRNDQSRVRCTPSSYKGLSILYIDESQRVTLRTFDNVIVSECQCT